MITHICLVCDKKFYAHKSAHRKYCSKRCAGKVNVENNLGKYIGLRGKEHPFYGRHLTDEQKGCLSESVKQRYKNPSNNPFFGKHHTRESREKMSLSQKGHPSKFKGKTYEEIYGDEQAKRVKNRLSETKRKYRLTKSELEKSYLGEKLSVIQIAEKYGINSGTIYKRMRKYSIPRRTRSEANKIRFRDPEYIKRISKIRKERNSIQNIIRNHHIRPNKLEQKLIDIIKKHNLPYQYTGDGKFWVENINPDFVECNGKKIAIEVFGEYWHNPLLNPKIAWNRTFEGRQKTYRKYGWKCVIIWENELLQLPEEKIIAKLGFQLSPNE